MPPSPAGAERAQPRVGIDLDNTICDYTAVFGPVAVELGLAPEALSAASKQEIRAHLRASESGETAWMRLQGQVYGRYLPRATPYPGALEAIERLIVAGASVSIVSHKTRRGHFDPDRIDLWAAARDWLTANGLLQRGVSMADVHFLETREAKLAKIAALECDVFVDDLPEVLLHPDFPTATRAIWFAGLGDHTAEGGLIPYQRWDAVERAIFAAVAEVR